MEELRRELVFYARQMLKCGLTMHTGGNLSARDRETGLVAITPTSLPYDLMEPADVSILDLEGQVVEGHCRPSSEWPMHTLVYREKPAVMAVVHTHSLWATACSVAGVEIPLLTHELAVYCSHPVRIAPFAMPGTRELGERAVEFMGDSNVVLLQGHGPLAVGATLWHAFDAACAVEQAARVFILSRLLGRGTPIPADFLARLRSYDPLLHPGEGKPEVRSV